MLEQLTEGEFNVLGKESQEELKIQQRERGIIRTGAKIPLKMKHGKHNINQSKKSTLDS